LHQISNKLQEILSLKMKTVLKIISAIGLALTLVPAIFVFMQAIEFSTHKSLMTIGMLLWFLSTPFWMKQQS